MKTMLKLSPRDHGKRVDYDDFMAAKYAPGYKYEIIDGRIYVSSEPNLPENRVEIWLFMKMGQYMLANLHVINYLTNKARIFVPGRPGITVPEPDLAAYRDFPVDLPFDELRWEDVSPILACEVLTGDETHKDMVRNVELYFQVPSIREYWLFDARVDANRPNLTVRRRHGRRWVVHELEYGETYTTRLLPGFTLKVDPRSF
jgi:Uma2 family endonuclease